MLFIMKLKFLLGFLIVLVTAIIIAAMNVTHLSQNGLSNISLANIEALSQIEFVHLPCDVCGSTSGTCTCTEWCSIHCCYAPGRCWHKALPYYWEECQLSAITTDYCTCCN